MLTGQIPSDKTRWTLQGFTVENDPRWWNFLCVGSTNWDPQARWMVYLWEDQMKMDDDWGYPYFWKAPCVKLLYLMVVWLSKWIAMIYIHDYNMLHI